MTEEQLREAALQAERLIASRYPDPAAYTHQFSPHFERKMRALRRRARHPYFYPSAKRIASFLLIILLSCGTWLGVDAQAREAFLGWVGREAAGWQSYAFSGPPARETLSGHYILPKLPEGYREYRVYLSDQSGEMTYLNRAGQFFSFGYLKQAARYSTAEIAFATGDIQPQAVQVNGRAADLYLDESGELGNVIVWQNEDKTVLFYLNGYLSKEALLYFAERVQPVEEANQPK